MFKLSWNKSLPWTSVIRFGRFNSCLYIIMADRRSGSVEIIAFIVIIISARWLCGFAFTLIFMSGGREKTETFNIPPPRLTPATVVYNMNKCLVWIPRLRNGLKPSLGPGIIRWDGKVVEGLKISDWKISQRNRFFCNTWYLYYLRKRDFKQVRPDISALNPRVTYAVGERLMKV